MADHGAAEILTFSNLTLIEFNYQGYLVVMNRLVIGFF